MATNDGHAFDDGHLVFIWVLGEGVCAGLLVLVSCEAREKERLLLTMPAAPPPMMTTFFLPFLRSSSEDMITVGSWVYLSVVGKEGALRMEVVVYIREASYTSSTMCRQGEDELP